MTTAQDHPVTVIATLHVRREAREEFEAFERVAMREVAAHGGALERVIVAEDGGGPELVEVHLLRFPSRACLDAYRASPVLVSMAALRARAITRTELLIGVARDPRDYLDTSPS